MERALHDIGVKVTTATTDDDGPGRYLTIDSRSSELGISRVYKHKLLDFYKFAPGLVPWLWTRVRDFDLVHIHALFSFTSAAAAVTARSRGVPYIVRPLGTLAEYGMSKRHPRLKPLSLALLEKRILQHAAAVHFTSQAEFDDAKAQGLSFRGIVIPLGVEAAAPGDPQRLLSTYPVLQGKVVVLYLSRLNPQKNLEGLLRAFSALHPQRPDIVLLIAGSGNPTYVSGLQSLAGALGLDAQVIWLGHVDGACKSAALSLADVFVLPSFTENFGIAAVEALLAGIPCLLTRGVGIAGEVQAAGAGLVVEPEPAAIAEALAKLVDDESQRRIMGERGRQLALQNYDVAVMAERLLRLYRNIFNSRVAAA
jgi:glycosyltransferase involved in cell wall biosynthesis